MRPRWVLRASRALCWVLLVHATGCTFTFSTPTAARTVARPGEPAACASNRRLAVADVLIALGLGAYGATSVVVGARALGCGPGGCPNSTPAVVTATGIAALVPAVVYAISAAYGLRGTSGCGAEEATRKVERQLA